MIVKTRLLLAISLLIALFAGGCAHPINVTGDAAALIGTGGGAKVERRVGLLVTDDQRKREVTSAGGGGDKINYFPYRDLEAGLYVALGEVFAGVTRISSATDDKVKADGVTLIVSPDIATTSHSPSLVTWPPTIFTVELSCTIKDTNDRVVSRVRVQGEGRAEFDEFKSDPSLSAKRAATDALKKLVKALSDVKPTLR
jgi:hypothetical protein